MSEQPLLARKIPFKTKIRCDWDRREIPLGENGVGYATQITGDETILAQGVYHSKLCYESALADYQNKLKGVEENA